MRTLAALPLGGDPSVHCEKSADLHGKSLVIGNPPRPRLVEHLGQIGRAELPSCSQ